MNLNLNLKINNSQTICEKFSNRVLLYNKITDFSGFILKMTAFTS